MPDLKRILILTADVGFGHRSAANAIAAAIRETYSDRCTVEIANPMDDPRTPFLIRDSQTDYDRWVREMPELYRLQYQLSESLLPQTLMESSLTVAFYEVMRDILKRVRPDVIICTHPMYAAPMGTVMALQHTNIPLLVVVTDMGVVHKLWYSSYAELVLLPNSDVYKSALESLPPEKLRVTGIPVNPKLVQEKRPASEIRAELGWQTDMITFLVVSSKRVKGLEPVLNVWNHSALPVQWIIAAGGDDETYNRLKAVEWHGTVKLYNFVDRLPTFMRAADGIVCKAGGLITTEGLAAGLPILLVDVTPGQEEGNADYVVKNGAGEVAADPAKALEILFHWLDHDQALLKQRAQASYSAGRPLSSYVIADLAWEVAVRGPLPEPESRSRLLPRLRTLLHQFNIAGEDLSPSAE